MKLEDNNKQQQEKQNTILATNATTTSTTAASVVSDTTNNINNNNYVDKPPSSLAWMIGIFVVGSSAGLTLYTRRSQSWLRTLKQVNDNVIKKQGPVKYGPPTKQQYEKTRTRFDEEDIV